MAEEAALARVQTWWGHLDESTKSIFEQLYQRDPAVVIDVLGGGEVSARDGTLESFLNVDVGEAMKYVPIIVGSTTPTIDPAEPETNAEFIISWTEENASQVTCPAYMNYVQIITRDNQVVWEQTFDRSELGPGETSDFSILIQGLPAQTYLLVGYLNSAGIEYGKGMPDAAGFRGEVSAAFGVGGFGTGERPSDPGEADARGMIDAYHRLNAAYHSYGDEGLRQAAGALYAFAAVLDTGGVVERESEYKHDLMVDAIQRAQWLEREADSTFPWTDEKWTVFREEVMAALQAIYPLTVDPRQIQARSAEVAEAINKIGQQSLRRE
jgi:hypothetical protein